MTLVDISQQVHVRLRVAGREFPPLIPRRLYTPTIGVARNQPCYLRPAQARHARNIPTQQTLFRPAQPVVFVTLQRPLRPGVHFFAAPSEEPHVATPCQTSPDLLQAR